MGRPEHAWNRRGQARTHTRAGLHTHTRLDVHAYVYMPSNKTSQGPSRMAAHLLPPPKRDARKTRWPEVEQQKINKKRQRRPRAMGAKLAQPAQPSATTTPGQRSGPPEGMRKKGLEKGARLCQKS